MRTEPYFRGALSFVLEPKRYISILNLAIINKLKEFKIQIHLHRPTRNLSKDYSKTSTHMNTVRNNQTTFCLMNA